MRYTPSRFYATDAGWRSAMVVDHDALLAALAAHDADAARTVMARHFADGAQRVVKHLDVWSR
jgi:DNA-binding FadR family transcriptional regulator